MWERPQEHVDPPGFEHLHGLNYLAQLYIGHFPPCCIPLGMSVSTKGPSDVLWPLGSRKIQIPSKDKTVP